MGDFWNKALIRIFLDNEVDCNDIILTSAETGPGLVNFDFEKCCVVKVMYILLHFECK